MCGGSWQAHAANHNPESSPMSRVRRRKRPFIRSPANSAHHCGLGAGVQGVWFGQWHPCRHLRKLCPRCPTHPLRSGRVIGGQAKSYRDSGRVIEVAATNQHWNIRIGEFFGNRNPLHAPPRAHSTPPAAQTRVCSPNRRLDGGDEWKGFGCTGDNHNPESSPRSSVQPANSDIPCNSQRGRWPLRHRQLPATSLATSGAVLTKDERDGRPNR